MRLQKKSPVPFHQRTAAPINDVIAHTGLTRHSIYRAVAEGRLHSVMVNGRRLLSVPSVLRLLEMGNADAAA